MYQSLVFSIDLTEDPNVPSPKPATHWQRYTPNHYDFRPATQHMNAFNFFGIHGNLDAQFDTMEIRDALAPFQRRFISHEYTHQTHFTTSLHHYYLPLTQATLFDLTIVLHDFLQLPVHISFHPKPRHPIPSIHIGPITHSADYQALLPGQLGIRKLIKLLRKLIGCQTDCHIELLAAKKLQTRTQLHHTNQLGWTTWL